MQNGAQREVVSYAYPNDEDEVAMAVIVYGQVCSVSFQKTKSSSKW